MSTYLNCLRAAIGEPAYRSPSAPTLGPEPLRKPANYFCNALLRSFRIRLIMAGCYPVPGRSGRPETGARPLNRPRGPRRAGLSRGTPPRSGPRRGDHRGPRGRRRFHLTPPHPWAPTRNGPPRAIECMGFQLFGSCMGYRGRRAPAEWSGRCRGVGWGTRCQPPPRMGSFDRVASGVSGQWVARG